MFPIYETYTLPQIYVFMLILIHLTYIYSISYYNHNNEQISNSLISSMNNAYLKLEIPEFEGKVYLHRTFISSGFDTCIFSLKTKNGYGIYNVCNETGQLHLTNMRFNIKKGNITTSIKKEVMVKKVVKIFLLNENKRVIKIGKKLHENTILAFKIAKEIIEKENFGEYKIELVLHGILNIDKEDIKDWNIYDALSYSLTHPGLDAIDEYKIIEKYKKLKNNILDNNKSVLKNIDDKNQGITPVDKRYGIDMLVVNSKNVDPHILDDETEKKLRNIGLNEKKLEIKEEDNSRRLIGAYNLITKFRNKLNFDENEETKNDKPSKNYQSPESLEKYADFIGPIKNDPKNAGSLFATSNLIMLLTDKEDNNSIEGLTFIGGACSSSDCFSIVRFKKNDSLFYRGKIMAHEILHSLNATHDKEGNGMIMEKQGCTTCMEDDRNISNQTKEQISAFIKDQQNTCFEKYNSCGSGMIEDGKECDSGSPFGSKCCMDTCNLKEEAQCDDINGKCCKDCKLIPKGGKCGYAYNECELASYCDGVSPECKKLYKSDNTPCNQGICKKGVCQNRDLMCKRIGRKFDEGCNAANSCKLVCVDKKNQCNLMGAFLKDLQTVVNLPDGIPCKLGDTNGMCRSGTCMVKKQYEKHIILAFAFLSVLTIVFIIILGFFI